MNDNPAVPALAQLPPSALANPELVRVAEELLAKVKAGEVHGLAVVMALGPEKPAMVASGAFTCTMVAGLQHLARQLLDGLFSGKRPSPILMPRRQ